MKRILLVTQYIYPETFKSSEMAFELVNKNYRVDVLCGIPNYPEGHYYKGYGLFRKRIETIKGVYFYRCFQTPRKLLPGFIGLSLNFLSFVFSSLLWVLFFFSWKKYDAIIVHAPSPVTQAIPACVLGKIRHTPVYTWIQDIWPDSVISTVGEKGLKLKTILQTITDWVYKNSTRILVTSKGMCELINRTYDYSKKIVYFPQWSDEMYAGYEKRDNETLSYNIMMAGSLNDGIGVPALMSLCLELKNDKVKFTFVGGGNEEQNMRAFVNDNHLNNVYFTGRKAINEMPSYFTQADAMLLSLKETHLPHLKATVPARLQSYMSAGKPILAMIEGSAADIIKDADCGYAVSAGDYKGLANYIRETVLPNKNSFAEKGKNARIYFLDNFTKGICINNLINIMEGK